MESRSLSEKLGRFKDLLAPAAQVTTPKPSARPPARYERMAEMVGGELVSGHNGTFVHLKNFFPLHYVHGQITLDDTLAQQHHPLSAFTALEHAGQIDHSEIVYFDTETTGLRGIGVVPFMIGFGRVVDGGFEVHQYLIPDYSDEAAMLEALLPVLTDTTRLVTYNGLAFDLPIVRDRMIVNRVARAIELGDHIDLLPATRRLFKRRIKDCALTWVEKQLFDFHRVDDIPGYLGPSVYFEWLASERLDMMHRLLVHNRLDILSLHFLLHHIATAFRTEGAALSHSDDLYSLSRVYRRRNRNDKVLNLCDRIASEEPHGLTEEILLFHAAALKRAGEWERATALWRQLAETGTREAYRANLELAMYFEHRGKDAQRALAHTRRAETLCPHGKSEKARLERRRLRLVSRLSAPAES